jgi:hypothetical protein
MNISKFLSNNGNGESLNKILDITGIFNIKSAAPISSPYEHKSAY